MLEPLQVMFSLYRFICGYFNQMTVAKPGSITKHQDIKNLKILEPILNDTYLNYEVYQRFDAIINLI